MAEPRPLSPEFRKLPVEERRTILLEAAAPAARVREFFAGQNADRTLADIMTENAVGYMEIPLGFCLGLTVNGQVWNLPLATEEPSVAAAASYAGRLMARGSGLTAEADEPVMRAQVFLEVQATAKFEKIPEKLQAGRSRLEALIRPQLASMEKRGGGFRALAWKPLPELGLWEVTIDVAVCDAMGANLLNTLAEGLTPELEALTGTKKLMAILSNDGFGRLARAQFEIPVAALAKPGFSGEEMARRVVLAAAIAQHEPQRAVTHNKGIMNGISALALATGNDTRALEAAVHAWAAKSGSYRGLTLYSVEGDKLRGRIELPVSLATVGGAMGIHPGAELALDLLGRPSARELAAVAAALGLAQNFAALFALAGEGIQRGHMGLHSRRVAYLAGARGPEVDRIAALLNEEKNYTTARAAAILATGPASKSTP